MLQIDDAIKADAVVSPGSLALGEIESGSATRILRIKLRDDNRRGHGRGRRGGRGHGHDDDAATYTLGHTPALSTGSNTFVPGFTAAPATVAFSQPTVVVGDNHRGGGDDDDDDAAWHSP